MSDNIIEPTAEELRAAAAVIRKMNSHPLYHEETAWSPNALDNHASFLEDKQAQKAKRDKRIEELEAELYDMCLGCSWKTIAEKLLTRYPSLLDEDGER